MVLSLAMLAAPGGAVVRRDGWVGEWVVGLTAAAVGDVGFVAGHGGGWAMCICDSSLEGGSECSKVEECSRKDRVVLDGY